MPDFSYCQVCNRNHDQGKRHRYAVGHKAAVETLLNKQREKFAAYRTHLDNPESVPVGRQRAAWCFFCCADMRPDVAADKQFASNSEKPGGDGTAGFAPVLTDAPCCRMHVLEHLATKKHAAKVDAWFRANNADRAAAAVFKIETAVIEMVCRGEGLVARRRRLQELTAQIEKREAAAKRRKERNRMAREAWLPTDKQSGVPSDYCHRAFECPAHTHCGFATVSRTGQEIPLSVLQAQTFAAPLEGALLPCTSQNALSTHARLSPPGVRTTAAAAAVAPAPAPPDWRTNTAGPRSSCPFAPPWLISDSAASFLASGEEIGPSAQAFLDAQRAAKKKKLNPKRLGADLDRREYSWAPVVSRNEAVLVLPCRRSGSRRSDGYLAVGPGRLRRGSIWRNGRNCDSHFWLFPETDVVVVKIIVVALSVFHTSELRSGKGHA
ncbi:MAG: coiled coil protein 84-domain-containing protein [Olpidium bornovanus]|uniref:Coiled coil protein 84-domain-containing protein n=1 Tax=Olpidium bornovanus TaxID=278681 RepID=A0A8H8DLB7_9FUNG|nr:MAG: coiled coil protein 84-domain-containing protein [Olpidium bornovanus]